MSAPQPSAGWRILGFGKDADVAAKLQAKLRGLGLQATIFGLADDAEGDARLIDELKRADYDGVSIGGAINGQNTAFPPTAATTAWFNRLLNIIHAHASKAKIILVHSPDDVPAAIERELGRK
jgi:hypothetical protein